MGVHGEFDALALSACRSLRHTNKGLEIEVVVTSLNTIKNDSELTAASYDDVKTVMFDMEDANHKRRITLNNRQMIIGWDTLVYHVDISQYRSGDKTAMRYDDRRGLKIVNLYCEEDWPFYGMIKEEIEDCWEKF